MSPRYLIVSVMLVFSPVILAESFESTMEMVEVTAEKLSVNVIGLEEEEILEYRARTNDSASLLGGLPGLSLKGAGGVSSLPVIHGLADDRLLIQVDGMNLVSACANHMNPPLSYIDPANLGSVEVFAGITPVSVGGDSIGGTVRVTSPAPEFAMPGNKTLTSGRVGFFYRSNGSVKGGNASATLASERLSMAYTGSYVKSGNYYAADEFKSILNPEQIAGTVRVPEPDEVGSSLYRSINHALRFALRRENHLYELKLGLQDIPYQGFPNQRMDMTDNDSKHVNFFYTGQYDWGVFRARAYHENTRHKMNFLDNKLQLMNPAGMPMDTKGKTTGIDISADIILSETDILRVGSDYLDYGLDEWWDPIGPWVPGPQPGKGMRGDAPFLNINNGKRRRFDAFVEWESHWSQKWLSQIGLRSSTIMMDTDDVRGYNTLPETLKGGYGDPTDPATIPGAFNARGHKRTDHNFDFTALASYTPMTGLAVEGGYARKVRSPNLYERYTWATTNIMVMNMVNWTGEANGYVGDLDIEPEVAHILSATLEWLDPEDQNWSLRVTPYYKRIDDYIDVERCSGGANFSPCKGANLTKTVGFAYLRFVNQRARIYGLDVSGHFVLLDNETIGRFIATGIINYVDGRNTETRDDLFSIMPLNATLAVEHRWGHWSNTLEWQLVDGKDSVSRVRNEYETSGYGLLNFRGSYSWKRARLDYGVDNLLNKFYEHPLGGAYVGEGNVMGHGATWGIAVPGMGLSVFGGVTLTF